MIPTCHPKPTAVRTDADLVLRYVRDRDAETFRELARRLGPVALAAARMMTRDEQEAEDAAQVTLAELARKAGTIEDPAAAAGWVRTAAVRATLKLKRARRRWRPLDGEPAEPAEQWDVVRQTADAEALHEELAELPDSWREPLLLRYFGGLDNEQAAARLGCTVASLEGRLKRGKRTLRVRLLRRGVDAAVVLATLKTASVASAADFDWDAGGDAALELSADSADLPAVGGRASATATLNKTAVLAAVAAVAALLSLSGGDASRAVAPVISTLATAQETDEGPPAEVSVEDAAAEVADEVEAGDGGPRTYEIAPWQTPAVVLFLSTWQAGGTGREFTIDGGRVTVRSENGGLPRTPFIRLSDDETVLLPTVTTLREFIANLTDYDVRQATADEQRAKADRLAKERGANDAEAVTASLIAEAMAASAGTAAGNVTRDLAEYSRREWRRLTSDDRSADAVVAAESRADSLESAVAEQTVELEPWMTPAVMEFVTKWEGVSPDDRDFRFEGSAVVVTAPTGETVVLERTRDSDRPILSDWFGRREFATLTEFVEDLRKGGEVESEIAGLEEALRAAREGVSPAEPASVAELIRLQNAARQRPFEAAYVAAVTSKRVWRGLVGPRPMVTPATAESSQSVYEIEPWMTPAVVAFLTEWRLAKPASRSFEVTADGASVRVTGDENAGVPFEATSQLTTGRVIWERADATVGDVVDSLREGGRLIREAEAEYDAAEKVKAENGAGSAEHAIALSVATAKSDRLRRQPSYEFAEDSRMRWERIQSLATRKR